MTAWPSALAARLSAWRAAGLERRLRVAEGRGVRLELVEGSARRAVISFASNDYLGLSQHPRVIAAAKAALDASGTGATASRLLCGTKSEHVLFEEDLAHFKRTEAALVFASGYQAALATLTALADCDCTVILDRLAHACLLDGAQLSGARVRTFKHNDVADLRRLLAACGHTNEHGPTRTSADHAAPRASSPQESTPFTPSPVANPPSPISNPRSALPSPRGRVLVVVESLYSMDGDVAPLAEIRAACREAGAWLLVDEAHATGVLGRNGGGVLADVFPDEPLPEDVLALGTLSKALGSQGGFLCATRQVCDVILHAGRALMFSTGLAPASAAAARAALEIASHDEDCRLKFLARAERLRAELRAQGWEVLGGPGPILPLLVGEENRALACAEALLAQGLWVPAIRYPTVKRGAAWLRISLSAAHTAEELRVLSAALAGLRPTRGT